MQSSVCSLPDRHMETVNNRGVQQAHLCLEASKQVSPDMGIRVFIAQISLSTKSFEVVRSDLPAASKQVVVYVVRSW